MWEIYAITTLSTFGAILAVVAIICTVAILGLIIAYIVILCEYNDCANEVVKEVTKPVRTPLKIAGIVLTISTIVTCLIPSKQDMYLIFGLGTVIDYCQNSPKVKEIPDKAIDALTTWLDMSNKESDDK